jgi:hypothetical protein
METENPKGLLPWRKARTLQSCHLFWIPTLAFPAPQAQRLWLLRFLELFTQRIALKRGLVSEQFLQMKVVQPDLIKLFLNSAAEFNPVFGLSRKPGEPMPPLPDMKYVEQLQKGERTYDQRDGKPDYCYWFLYKLSSRQRELFLGHGGLTAVFVKPDPAGKAPTISIPKRALRNPAMKEVIEKSNLQGMMDGAYAMKAGFLQQSKEMFGADLKEEPAYKGLPFIVPLLESEAFFRHAAAEVKRWFTLFDFYYNESPSDRGMLLAAKDDIEAEMADLVDELRGEGLVYRE